VSGARLDRGAITDAVIATAELVGFPIGDAEAPRDGVAGWQGGQPNQDGTNFVPYSVITPLSVTTGSGPLSDSEGDLVIPYAVTSYGVSRKQCEWMADSVRLVLDGLTRTNIVMFAGKPTEYARRVQQVVDQTIGAVQRVSDTDPAYYGQSDVLALWTSR
jgi:hypothetical protein